jgi:diadenosine tetraphosphate (Ap4A) HIT family hydrolase
MDYNKPEFLYEFKYSYVEMSYYQFLPGYSILFSKTPYYSLNDMPVEERKEYLIEMSILGDAMMEVLKPIRINYATLGNSLPVLHTHLFPRYEWEDDEIEESVIWDYPKSKFYNDKYRFSLQEHKELKEKLRIKIDELYNKYKENNV